MSEQEQSSKAPEPQNEPGRNSQLPNEVSSAVNPLDALIANLEILKTKINKGNAFLGIVGGFAAFAFSLFLTWAKIPTGIMVSDGGTASGWHEAAFCAIIPLAIALFPVFRQRAVGIKAALVAILLSFCLLGYNNVLHRTSWGTQADIATWTPWSNFGSDLGAGFWIGLIAMAAISICGIAWALHTRQEKERQDSEIKKGLETNGNHQPATEQPDSANKTTQRLWNPQTASVSCLLLTPMFGMILHALNWKELSKSAKAKADFIWAGGFLAFIFFSMLYPIGKWLIPLHPALESELLKAKEWAALLR